MVPQSMFKMDSKNDTNVPVDGVKLTIIAPDNSWKVFGPGVTGEQKENTYTFKLDTPMPLYAISFAASPNYEFFKSGESKSGVEIFGTRLLGSSQPLQEGFASAAFAIDWMEANIGPYRFGKKISFMDIPEFTAGGMEHATIVFMNSSYMFSEAIIAMVTIHETVHHWWGDNVRFADFNDFWIAEGFDEWSTNYNILCAMYDSQSCSQIKNQYRVDAANTCAAFDTSPLSFEDMDFMVLFGDGISVFYKYGAAFVEMLNQRLIRDFNSNGIEFAKKWFEAKEFSSVTTRDLIDFLGETYNNQEYFEKLFADWVYGKPCPKLEAVDYIYENGVAKFTLGRINKSHGMEKLPIVIVVDGVEITKEIDFPEKSDSVVVEIPSAKEPSAIFVDPNGFFVFKLATEEWNGPAISFLRESEQ